MGVEANYILEIDGLTKHYRQAFDLRFLFVKYLLKIETCHFFNLWIKFGTFKNLKTITSEKYFVLVKAIRSKFKSIKLKCVIYLDHNLFNVIVNYET